MNRMAIGVDDGDIRTSIKLFAIAERASNLSPSANGSYAPKGSSLLSPGLGMHKSHSVGFDLKDENGGAGGGGARNGKRKQDEPGEQYSVFIL